MRDISEKINRTDRHCKKRKQSRKVKGQEGDRRGSTVLAIGFDTRGKGRRRAKG